MVVVMIVPGVHRVEMALRAAAGLVLHLHRGMLNFIFMFQEMQDAVEQRIMIVRRDHLNMERHHRFFPHQPDVDVVNIAYLRDRATDIPLQGRHIQRTRRAFQQFIQTLL